jgi:hypothetical protein
MPSYSPRLVPSLVDLYILPGDIVIEFLQFLELIRCVCFLSPAFEQQSSYIFLLTYPEIISLIWVLLSVRNEEECLLRNMGVFSDCVVFRVHLNFKL